MEASSKSVVESREELMVSPTIQGDPTLRKSHFLNPSMDSDLEPISGLASPSLPPTFDPKKWPLTVNFYGWMNPSKNWKEWVQKMASLHAPAWKKSGIYDAILNSTCRFNRNDDLVLGVSERWNPNTNSFIFPWGEATVTLEDMLIAGYSVLGSPVYEPIVADELKAIEEALIQERKKLNKSSVKKPLHCAWLKVFKDSGSEIEHEAFLSMWLCRFVLPTSRDVICKCVFPIAIHLARGTRVALAPAVLATIYRDLSLVKEKIVALSALDGESNERLVVTTWAPFQLVLLWIWERFAKLSPKPSLIKSGEPRFTQWDNLNNKFENARLVLDSSKESFSWRPYTKTVANWEMPKFYKESEMWVSPDSDVDEEIQAFIRCSRVSELVGLECIEQYLPHRVGRQLGFDQDLPGIVARCNASREDAWEFYSRSVTGSEFYVPACLFEGGVTTRYLEWWNRSVSVQQQEKKNEEITPKASKEERRILSSPESSKRKRAVSELMELEVSATSSEQMKNGKTSRTPRSKKAAGEVNDSEISVKDASKSPATKKEAGKLKSSERKKKGEASKSPAATNIAAEEPDESKVSAKSSKRTKKATNEAAKSPKRKVSSEAAVARVKRSKKSKALADISSVENEESNEPATNLDEPNIQSFPPGFSAITDTVDSAAIAEMVKDNNSLTAEDDKQCGSGENLEGKVDSYLSPVECAKTSENEKGSDSKTASSQSHSNSSSPADNEISKDFNVGQSETSEIKQTHSNQNASKILHQSPSNMPVNETVIEASGSQLDGFQGLAENIGDGNPNSCANVKDLEILKPAMSVERAVDNKEAPRLVDESESHLSSVAGNETLKVAELPEEKAVSIETGNVTQDNCSVEGMAQNGNEGGDNYGVLEERIDKLVMQMDDKKTALLQKHFIVN